MKEWSTMYRTLYALRDLNWYYGWELNKKTGYYKACTRASDLVKQWYATARAIERNGRVVHKYKITAKWLSELQLWPVQKALNLVRNFIYWK